MHPGGVSLYQALAKKPDRDPEEEEFIETMYQTMEEYRAEGLVKGHLQGRTEGFADALLTVLQGRGIAVSDAAREPILAEKDPAQLTRWLERAGVVTSIDDLFGDAR